MPLQADLDGDGIVTADEMALALKLDHEGDGVIDVDLDLDGDGIVTAAEMKLALKADKDGDGLITTEELLKARDAPATPADRRHAALLAARVASSLKSTEAEEQSWAVDDVAEPLASLFFKKRDRQLLVSLQQREERRRRAEELARAAAKIMEDEAAAARQQREAAMTSAERLMRGGKKKKKKTSIRRKSSSRKKKGSPPRPPPIETSIQPVQKKLPSPLARDRARKAKTWGKAATTLLERFDSDVLMVEDEYGELRLTPEMRVKVDELFVEIGGGPDIDAKSFRGALVHLGIVVSDGEAASMFEAADSDGGGTLDRDEFADTIAGVLAPLVELRRESVQPSIVLPEMSSILSLQSLQTDILQEVLDRDDSVAQFVHHASEEFRRVESERQAELFDKFKWKRPPTPAPVPAPVVVEEAPPPKRQEKKKPAPRQKNDKKPKKRPRRSPWHLYEKLRPVLRPHASDELGKAYMEHHTHLDAELRLIQDELRSRLAPATEDEWRTASGFHNTGADLAALGKKASKWSQRFRGMGSLRRNEDGTVSSHAKAEAAAGIVRERFPLRQAFSPRRLVQSSERDACFRKFSSINCEEPFTRNGREARLLRRCGRIDDLEKALQGFDIVYRGQLSSVKLAEALREVLKDVDDEPDPFYDDIEGIHFKLEDVDTETVDGICKKLSGEDKPKTPSLYWICECGMARNLQNQETCSKCHAPRHSPLSDFVDLVQSTKAFYAVQPLKQALDNALLVPMDRPGPLCWANLTRPGDGLSQNPGPKNTWRSSGKKKKKRRRRRSKEKLPKRREFTLGDESAMKLRGEFSVDGADSLENRMMAMGPVASVADMSGALSPLTP